MKISTTHIGKWQFDKYEDNGKWLVKLYNNNARLSWKRLQKYYAFKTEESAIKWIVEQTSNIQSHLDWKNERKASKKAFVNPAKVGDVLVCSWGYDQTNIDYYQVLEVKNKSVVIQEIGFNSSENNGYGQDKVMPAVNGFKKDSEPMLKLVNGDINHPEEYHVTINSYSWAYLWDGKPDYQTDAYSGH